MSSQPWEEIEHTADWALRVWGDDLRALMEHAACGMMSLLGDATLNEITFQRSISIQAIDAEMLLVNWLTELLYLVEDEGIVFSEISVHRADATGLDADVQGGVPGEEMRKHIKAVTYHMLEIRPSERGLETVIVFDV